MTSAAVFGLEFEEPPPLAAAAPSARRKQKRTRTTPPDYVAPDSHRAHGTRAKYVIERCRCNACRAVASEYQRRRVRAISRPDEAWVPYVPAGPARRHVERLGEQGVGAKSVAKLAGVPHGTISKLLYGDPRRGMRPSKRIRPETARKILAVTVDQAAGAQKIDATATWRMLDELIAKGWPKAHLAELIIGRTARSLQIQRTLVRASTARRVEQVYAQLKDQPAPGRRSRTSR